MEERIPELMGMDDEVVVNYAISQLEEAAQSADQAFDPKRMQVYLKGFMGETSMTLLTELQTLLLEGQEEPTGIPKQLVKNKLTEKERKMMEIEEAKKRLAMIRGFQSTLQPEQTSVQDTANKQGGFATEAKETKTKFGDKEVDPQGTGFSKGEDKDKDDSIRRQERPRRR